MTKSSTLQGHLISKSTRQRCPENQDELAFASKFEAGNLGRRGTPTRFSALIARLSDAVSKVSDRIAATQLPARGHRVDPKPRRPLADPNGDQAPESVITVEQELPSLDDIEELARRAFDGIPQRLRQQLGAVAIRVEEFPDQETLVRLGCDSPLRILGLYRGVPLPFDRASNPRPDLDKIYLYRQPILSYWRQTGEDLGRIVSHVLIHEIGHHIGFSDDDMERIEAAG